MTQWKAPKSVRRFQSSYRGANGVRHLGKMHVAWWYKFTKHGEFRDWIPACATPEQLDKWSLRAAPGRVLTAGATAPITCTKCIALARK